VSSETLERAQAIRAAIHSPGWHREDGLAALDALLAEVARLEQERDEAKHQRDNFERIAREQAERAHANWKRAEAAEAALAVAREREQRLREQVERIALNAESWHGYLPPDNAPGAGHVRALGVIATWARAALVDEPAAATLAEPGRRGANEPAVVLGEASLSRLRERRSRRTGRDAGMKTQAARTLNRGFMSPSARGGVSPSGKEQP
jgi:ribosomal protein L32E